MILNLPPHATSKRAESELAIRPCSSWIIKREKEGKKLKKIRKLDPENLQQFKQFQYDAIWSPTKSPSTKKA